jgi:hypothetical protein
MATESWKLHTLNENVRPPVLSYDQYPSKDDALRAACNELKKPHVKVEFIEGPDGAKIDEDAVEEYCRSHPAT